MQRKSLAFSLWGAERPISGSWGQTVSCNQCPARPQHRAYLSRDKPAGSWQSCPELLPGVSDLQRKVFIFMNLNVLALAGNHPPLRTHAHTTASLSPHGLSWARELFPTGRTPLKVSGSFFLLPGTKPEPVRPQVSCSWDQRDYCVERS